MRLVGFSKLLPLLLFLMASTTTTTSPTDSTTTTTDGSTTTTTTSGSTPTTTASGSTPTTTASGSTPTTTTSGSTTTTTASGSTPTTTASGSTPTTTASDSTTTTDDSTTTTTTTDSTSPTSTTAPLTGLDLYKETQDELKQITDILNKFEKLFLSEEEDASSVASKRYGWVGRAHPAMWWLRREGQAESSFTFCKEGEEGGELCHTLEGQLEDTNKLVTKLSQNMDDWKDTDLHELQQQRKGLNETYKEAEKDQDSFKESVKEEEFKTAIDEVNKNVIDATHEVEEKIDALSSDGSVALVAVLGTLGGLMIVALVGVIVYKFVKKPKTSSKTSGAPYDKLEGENIPIGRVTQEGQGSLQASRMDPYSQPPAHSSRRDPVYAGPYGPRPESSYGARSESMYGRPATSDAGRSLPRAHL